MKTRFVTSCFCLALAASLAACHTAPRTAQERNTLHSNAREALADFQQNDPKLQPYFDNSYAYAVFPAITQGGAGVGGAYGHGEVYRHGQLIGYCNVSQATIGAQLGGQ